VRLNKNLLYERLPFPIKPFIGKQHITVGVNQKQTSKNKKKPADDTAGKRVRIGN